MNDELTTTLSRLENKIDLILSEMLKKPGNGTAIDTKTDETAFRSLTTKQHAVCQLLLHNLSNKEMADVLGLQEPSVKVHVRGANKKFGVNRRSQTKIAYANIFAETDDDKYLLYSGGLPKDWYPEHLDDTGAVALLKVRGN